MEMQDGINLVVKSIIGTPPAAAGPAGAEFEVKVGSSYLLAMLADAPARGLPGSIIENVSFQKGDDGYPMDDVIVTTRGSSGEIAEALTAMPKPTAQITLKERLLNLPDRSFINGAAPFLQCLDDMTFGGETISIELAVEYRTAVADRMMETVDWHRLVGDTSSSMAVDFRPAISSLFHNSAFAYEPPTSRLLGPGIRRLDPEIPLFVKCISSAPSHAVAVFTMNLVEVEFMPSHKPMVLALADSCLKTGIVDRGFWINTGIGARVCSYFDKLLGAIADRESVNILGQELDDIVNQFILIGIPEAQRLHDALTTSNG